MFGMTGATGASGASRASGATGTTGRLVLESALAHGQRPIVAGRDAAAVRALADRHGLESAIVSLDDRAGLEAALGRSSRVLHTAGPFSRTAAAMLDACLATATPYLDMSGEVDVVAATLAHDEAARRHHHCREGQHLAEELNRVPRSDRMHSPYFRPFKTPPPSWAGSWGTDGGRGRRWRPMQAELN